MCVRQWQIHTATCFGQTLAAVMITASGALQYRGAGCCSEAIAYVHGLTFGARRYSVGVSTWKHGARAGRRRRRRRSGKEEGGEEDVEKKEEKKKWRRRRRRRSGEEKEGREEGEEEKKMRSSKQEPWQRAGEEDKSGGRQYEKTDQKMGGKDRRPQTDPASTHISGQCSARE